MRLKLNLNAIAVIAAIAFFYGCKNTNNNVNKKLIKLNSISIDENSSNTIYDLPPNFVIIDSTFYVLSANCNRIINYNFKGKIIDSIVIDTNIYDKSINDHNKLYNDSVLSKKYFDIESLDKKYFELHHISKFQNNLLIAFTQHTTKYQTNRKIHNSDTVIELGSFVQIATTEKNKIAKYMQIHNKSNMLGVPIFGMGKYEDGFYISTIDESKENITFQICKYSEANMVLSKIKTISTPSALDKDQLYYRFGRAIIGNESYFSDGKQIYKGDTGEVIYGLNNKNLVLHSIFPYKNKYLLLDIFNKQDSKHSLKILEIVNNKKPKPISFSNQTYEGIIQYENGKIYNLYKTKDELKLDIYAEETL